MQISGVAASVKHRDDSTASRRVSGQLRCIEVAAPNDLGKRIGIAIKGPRRLSADHLDESLRFANEMILTGDYSWVAGRVGHAAERIIDDPVSEGTAGDQLLRSDGVVCLGVADHVQDIWRKQHRGACRGGELATGPIWVLGKGE